MTAYTLHSQGSYGLGPSGLPDPFTLGTQFAVSESASLTGIWLYSGPDCVSLPTACVIYNANTGAQIAGTLNSSPSWSGAAGSGWVKCAYSGPALASGTNYVAAVYNNPGGAAWFDWVSAYWTSGAGSAGITNGPLSAPGSASAVNGQAVYNTASGGIAFPAATNAGYDFGVDVEVTTVTAGASAVTGGRIARRRPARAAWRSAAGPANAHGGNGTIQRRAAVPVPRRYPARALWRGPAAVTTVNAAPPAGQQPRGFTSSRRPVGGLWGGSYTPQANASGSSGSVQPRPEVARRAPARAVWRGTLNTTANAAPPLPVNGTVQPHLPVPRRVPSRVIWRGSAVPGVQPQHATGGLLRRRTPARGLWRGGAGPQPPAAPPGIPASGKSITTRRPPNRGQWHGTLVSTSNLLPVAVAAPRQRLTVPRRTATRVMWQGTAPVTSNAPPAPQTILFSVPYARQLWSVTAARNSS